VSPRADALNALGRYDLARTHCREALVLHQQIGNRHGEAATWDSLGTVHQRRGNHVEACDAFQRAATICREVGDRAEGTRR